MTTELDRAYAAAQRASAAKHRKPAKKRKAAKKAGKRRKKATRRRTFSQEVDIAARKLLGSAYVASPRKPAKRRKKATTKRRAKKGTTKRRKATAKKAPKTSRSRRPGESFKTHMARLRKLDGPRKRKPAKRPKQAGKRDTQAKLESMSRKGSRAVWYNDETDRFERVNAPSKRRKATAKKAPKTSRSRRPGESFKAHMARLRKADGR